MSAVVLILGGFIWREYEVANLPVPMIVVEENVVLIRVGGEELFGMGNIDSPRARAVGRSLLSFFARDGVYDVWDIETGGELRGGAWVVQRVSVNLARCEVEGCVVWLIGDGFSGEEKLTVVQSGVDFTSDWWVMRKNRLPDFLPIPGEGILFAGDRVPSKKTVNFAMDKKIPLISVRESGGVMVGYDDIIGRWELRVRE